MVGFEIMDTNGHLVAFNALLSVSLHSGMAPDRFGGGYDAISSMESSIHVHETTHVVQIYYVKSVHFHAGGGMHPSIPLEPSLNH